jgi:hypothetical protein
VTLRQAVGLAIPLLLFVPVSAGAEWHFKPFLGFSFAPSTTLEADIEHAAGLTLPPDEESQASNVMFGAGVTLLGEVFGIEGEWTQAPGFFQTREQELVTSSGAQTFTGSLVVAMPRRISQYSLRPYFVAGAGIMRLHSVPVLTSAIPIDDTLAAIDVGGGATGFFNERIGVGWDLRYFHSVGGEVTGDPIITTDGLAKQLSFWRANMALVLRY